jgi:predicted Zn-dependent protease
MKLSLKQRDQRSGLGLGAFLWAMMLAIALAGCASAPERDGVSVGKESVFTQLVPAEDVERASAQQYQKLLQDAQAQKALAGPDSAQLQRLRRIAQRIIPFSAEWSARSSQWRWEINLINSDQINAFCMPGGKIVFYSALLQQLQLNDDEVAMVMGHEIAHALREHARERMGKGALTSSVTSIASQAFGLGELGNTALGYGAQILGLRFSRDNETEADLVGMEIAARAGYDPHAGVSLWRKMSASSKGAPPQWLSTHPSGDSRIQEIEANLPKVLPLYQRSQKPTR